MFLWDFAGIIKFLEQYCIDLTDAANGIPMLETAIENGARFVVDRLLKEARARSITSLRMARRRSRLLRGMATKILSTYSFSGERT